MLTSWPHLSHLEPHLTPRTPSRSLEPIPMERAGLEARGEVEVVELDLAEAWGEGRVNDGASGLGGDGDLESEIAHCDPHKWAWIHFSPAK
ncbi:hypothetical protein ACFX19_027424 [Malus domestica]